MNTNRSLREKILDWFGQSIVDKLITLGLGVLAASTSIGATKLEPGTLQLVLVFLGILSGLAFLVVMYLNHRFARVQEQMTHHANLIQVVGFIVRHHINERPRTSLDRHVHFTNPVDRVKAVDDTIHAHRQEIEDSISQANPDMSLTSIRELLDVFYG